MDLDIIREATLARLADDPTFQTLTGANATRGQLYQSHMEASEISTAQKAYVTYRFMPHGESRSGVAGPIYSFVVWSRPEFYEAVSDIRTRIEQLFDRKKWTIGSRQVWSRVTMEQDLDQAEYGFIGRNIMVRVGTQDIAPA
jgi:hypothetical protein